MSTITRFPCWLHLCSHNPTPTAALHTLPGHIDLLAFRGPQPPPDGLCLLPPTWSLSSASCWEATQEKGGLLPSSLSSLIIINTQSSCAVHISWWSLYSMGWRILFCYFPGPTTSQGSILTERRMRIEAAKVFTDCTLGQRRQWQPTQCSCLEN